VGAGHVRAAQALELELRRAAPTATIAHHDVLTLMPPAFGRVYRDGYFDLVARAPQLLGWLYDATDKPFHKKRLQQDIERVSAVKLLKMIREFDADIAVCTHFLAPALLQRERRKGRGRARIVTVVTDFEIHGMWLGAESDHYFVATEEARTHLEALGVAPATITVSGIPTHPVFAENKDQAAMRRKYGLQEDIPTILVSPGGFDTANARRLLDALTGADLPAQIIAACGRNLGLHAAIDEATGGNPLVKTVGFTTDMDEYMAASDLMIGKPGGLTTSESLVKGLAWVVVNPIPGQEERNAIYLLENGAGVWCNNLHTLPFKVRTVLREPSRLQAMRASSLRLGRPDAGAVIAHALLE
jgi:processive 1,2-diacylglycerol beta-glucosyltransferase